MISSQNMTSYSVHTVAGCTQRQIQERNHHVACKQKLQIQDVLVHVYMCIVAAALHGSLSGLSGIPTIALLVCNAGFQDVEVDFVFPLRTEYSKMLLLLC